MVEWEGYIFTGDREFNVNPGVNIRAQKTNIAYEEKELSKSS